MTEYWTNSFYIPPLLPQSSLVGTKRHQVASLISLASIAFPLATINCLQMSSPFVECQTATCKRKCRNTKQKTIYKIEKKFTKSNFNLANIQPGSLHSFLKHGLICLNVGNIQFSNNIFYFFCHYMTVIVQSIYINYGGNDHCPYTYHVYSNLLLLTTTKTHLS